VSVDFCVTSVQDWPITGGEVTEKTGSASRNILLTG